MTPYKYVVYYQQDMVAGVLEGIKNLNVRLPFVTWLAANDFAAKCDGKTVTKECIGSAAYVKHSPILEALTGE